MKLLIIFLFLWPLSIHANQGYLKANKKFYSKVIGDGFEKGVQFTFRKKIPKVELEDIPLPVLEITNNRASCTGGIKIDHIKQTPGRFQWVYYKGLIESVVEEESGGCLGLARWPSNADILKIIDYYYISDI